MISKLLTDLPIHNLFLDKTNLGGPMMQYIRLNDAQSMLIAKLAPFPYFEIEACGMTAHSLRNWFRIRDRVSGKYFTVLVLLPADFLSARFEDLLKRFAYECGLQRMEAS